MTASEFSFLALGLVLGVVSGAALVEYLRARPPAPREVRLTVAHDAIPKRASTLADDAFVAVGPEPARGGPADRRMVASQTPVGTADRRTTVRFGQASEPTGSTGGVPAAGAPSMAGAIPVARRADPPIPGRIMEPALPLTGPGHEAGQGPMVGIPISSGDDPVQRVIRPETAATMTADLARGRAEVSTQRDHVPTTAMATDQRRERTGAFTAVALLDPPGPTAGEGAAPVATERCADERRLAEERCELATRARARSEAAIAALRAAQRGYEEHEAAAVTASWRADPRAIHDAKDTAQSGFRTAVSAAGDPDALEAAARDWLTEINRINIEARDAAAFAAREHAAAAAIGATIERLGLEADAARIGAETADAACLVARSAVADCEERAASDPSTFPVPPSAEWSDQMGGQHLEEDETLGIALEDGAAPRIFRLLRGDRQAMTSLVAALASDDPDGRRQWQLLMTSLVEAVIADAIEAAALVFPADHLFWGPFTRTQSRDVTRALASLGYRFDGLGGWTDERYPSQRDLSLALGYAGLDPMRVRHWPNAEETLALFHDVRVAADEYLAGIAGDLTLAEMVTMLGRRADGLAEVWNQWGRIRPLLLEEG